MILRCCGSAFESCPGLAGCCYRAEAVCGPESLLRGHVWASLKSHLACARGPAHRQAPESRQYTERQLKSVSQLATSSAVCYSQRSKHSIVRRNLPKCSLRRSSHGEPHTSGVASDLVRQDARYSQCLMQFASTEAHGDNLDDYGNVVTAVCADRLYRFLGAQHSIAQLSRRSMPARTYAHMGTGKVNKKS